jgi:DNA replication protein DnaC
MENIIGIGKPDCPYCGGLGYVVPNIEQDRPGFGRARTCECRRDEQERFKVDSLLKLSQIGALRHFTFDNFLTEGIEVKIEEQKESLSRAFVSAHEFAKEPVGWLLLTGGYGCGKTHLAAAIANYRLEQGDSVLFVNTPDLLDHLRTTFDPSSTVTLDERFEQVRTCPLLILDDLGAHSNSEWAQEKLYQLINYRYVEKLPTVITTNDSREELDPRLNSRLSHIERLDENQQRHGLVKVVVIDAPDFRRGGKQDDPLELSTLRFHYDKTFESFQFRGNSYLEPAQVANIEEAKRIARQYAEHLDGWLTFSSVASGNGKTHLAAAIANHARAKGRAVLFVVVPDLLDYLRASYNPNSNTRLDKRFDEVKNASLLILDDLGTESATPWAREKLYQLFNYRYSANKATVITTSLRIDELDPRLASRMLDPTRAIFFVLTVPGYYDPHSQSSKHRSPKRK